MNLIFKVFGGSVLVALLLLGAILIKLKRKQHSREEKINKSLASSGNGKNKLHIFYLIFKKTPFLKRYFEKVLKTTESIYPADQMSVNKKATMLMLNNLLVAIGIFVAVLIMSKGDLLYICMGALAGFVFFDYGITSSLSRMETNLLYQLQDFLSDIRHYYMSSKIIEDAVNDTLDDIPFEVSLHIQKLYNILISPIMQEKVEEYSQTNPNRFFLLLTSICTAVKEYGDTEDENGGSNFLNSIAYLKEEINIEILKRQMISFKFQALSFIALVPVLLLKPIETWNIKNMPDLASFYSGIYGKTIMVALFATSFICYKLVEVLKDSKRGELKRVSIWTRIAKIPVISKFTNKLINRNFTKAMKLNDKQKEIGDMTGPKAFLVESMTIGIISFILVNVMFSSAFQAQKVTMLKNFTGGFDESVIPNEKYLAIMQGTSKDYAEIYKKYNIKEFDEDELTNEIAKNSGVHNKDDARLVAQAVIDEVGKYQKTYYKWWCLLASIIVSILAMFIPYWFMDFRIKVASVNKEDEVNQFQTLILVLMHTDGITLDLILEWMDRFSYSFKSSIDVCIMELESGEKAALEKMKMSETNVSFKRFCDCLLEIDDVGVLAAFDEIASDRAYSLKNREQQNQITTDKKASKAMWISYIALGATFIFYLVGPMLMLSIKMFLAMDFSV